MRTIVTYFKQNPIIIALLFITLVMRLILSAKKEFYLDEFYDLFASDMILKKGIPIFPSGTYWSVSGILLYLRAPFLYFFGYDQFWLRILNVLISTSGIILIYNFLKKEFNIQLALIVSFLILIDIDMTLWGSIYARPYSVLWVLIIISISLINKISYKNSVKNSIGLAITLSLGIWINPLFSFNLPGLAFLYFIMISKINYKNLAIIITISLMVTFIVFLSMYLGDIGLFQSNPSKPSFLKSILNLSGISGILKTFISSFYPEIFTKHYYRAIFFVPYLFIIIISFSKLVNLQFKYSKDNKQFRIILSLIIFLIPTIFLNNFFYYNHFTYTIHLIPIFYIISSYGFIILFSGDYSLLSNGRLPLLINSKNTFIKKFILIVLITFISIIGLKHFIESFHNKNYLEAYKYVKKEWKSGDAILNSEPGIYIFGLGNKSDNMYFYSDVWELNVVKKNHKWVDRIFNDPWISKTDEIDSLFQKHKRVWFILRKEAISYRYSLSISFIREKMKLVKEIDDNQIYLKE